MNQKIGRSGQILLRSVLALGSFLSVLCWQGIRKIPSNLIALVAVHPDPGNRIPYHKPALRHKRAASKPAVSARTAEVGYTLNQFSSFMRYHCAIQGQATLEGQPRPVSRVTLSLETTHGRQTETVRTDAHGHYEVAVDFDAAADEPIHWRVEAGADSSERGEAEGQLIAMADQTSFSLDVPVRLEVVNASLDIPQALPEKINTQIQ